MKRYQGQKGSDKASYLAPAKKGGTYGRTTAEALATLGGVDAATVNQANGALGLDGTGTAQINAFSDGASITGRNAVAGAVRLVINAVANYLITDYDTAITYTLARIGASGTVSRSGDTITYTAPATTGSFGFTLNGRDYVITVVPAIPATPSITSPSNGAVGVSKAVSFTASAFSISDGSTHTNSDWQISTDANFTTIVAQSLADATNKTTWSNTLPSDLTKYFTRVRYRASNGVESDWSTVISFTTASSTVSADYLAVGGGGGGGGGVGGGGGGGGVKPGTISISSGVAVPVVVGDGGAGGLGGGDGQGRDGATGADSSVAGNTAFGGGGGGGGDQGRVGKSGGSGGGAGGANSGVGFYAGGTGTTGQGFAGGVCGQDEGGGGGGAGAVGAAGLVNPASGNKGGDGVSNSISGSPVFYGGGGGGGNGAGNTGGNGGGGAGGIYPTVTGQGPFNGTAGSNGVGGGGGAAGQQAGGTFARGVGGKGGSGTSIISVPLATPVATTTGSPTVTTTATRRIYTWTTVGSWTATWNL